MERGLGMVIEAVIVAALWAAFIQGGLLPRWLFVFFNVFSIIGLVFLIDKTRYWSFGYLAGWVVGLLISLDVLIQTGFLSLFDFILYGPVAGGAIWLRVRIHT